MTPPVASPKAAPAAKADAPAFLGVEAVRASAEDHVRIPSLIAGAGLRVRFVAPDSPATPVLRAGDVLTHLDEQILCNPEQLRVLIRARKPGENVRLKLRRGDADIEAVTALGAAPARTATRADAGLPFLTQPGDAFGQGFPPALFEQLPDDARAHFEELERRLGEVRSNLDGRIKNVRARAIVTEKDIRSRIAEQLGAKTVWLRDDAGSVCLKTCDGCRRLTVKSAEGATLFDGEVDTPAQREALPDSVKKRLKTIEQLAGNGALETSPAPAKQPVAPNAKAPRDDDGGVQKKMRHRA